MIASSIPSFRARRRRRFSRLRLPDRFDDEDDDPSTTLRAGYDDD
jgi:hypothetical protein